MFDDPGGVTAARFLVQMNTYEPRRREEREGNTEMMHGKTRKMIRVTHSLCFDSLFPPSRSSRLRGSKG